MRRPLQPAFRALAGALLLAMAALGAGAQERAPIRFVVPYPAGGAPPKITPQVAPPPARHLGAPIVSDNMGGAAGMIATAAALRAEPDGQTFFVGSNAPLVINQAIYARMPYDPEKDFVPVAGMGKSPLLLVTRKGLGVTDVPGLIALSAKAGTGFTMGSASSGNITHLAGEGASRAMGFRVTHVPFSGSAPAITSMLGENVDIMYDALPSCLQQAKAGRIVPLAILDARRFPQLPDVPTLREAGYAGHDASAWFGVMARAGTPRAAIDGMNKAVNDALAQPDLVARLNQIGAQPMPGSPASFGRFIADERARWIPLAHLLGVKAD